MYNIIFDHPREDRTIIFKEKINHSHEYSFFLKADLHGTIFAYDCRMQFL